MLEAVREFHHGLLASADAGYWAGGDEEWPERFYPLLGNCSAHSFVLEVRSSGPDLMRAIVVGPSLAPTASLVGPSGTDS